MSQHYSNPKRETEAHALPDVEVFYMSDGDLADYDWRDGYGDRMGEGWYWWSCFPGCLPDSDAFGPFATEAEALADARDGCDDDDDDDDETDGGK